jgi:CrcB protein
VNCTGSLLIGVLVTALDTRFSAVPSLRFFLIIGLLGGFTTFSSFSYETMTLLREGSTTAALINVGASVITCLSATWVGMTIGKAL